MSIVEMTNYDLKAQLRPRFIGILQQWYLTDAAEYWIDDFLYSPPEWSTDRLIELCSWDTGRLEDYLLGNIK